MARQTKDQRLAAIHREALEDFDNIQTASRDERMQCLSDRRFYSIPGAMWEGPLAEQFENKPKFEVNKVHNSVIRIFNEYRNNRITVDFVAKDGSDDDNLADTLDGLYRADEQDSCAEEAYDNAFEEGVGGGIGAWRLRACYEDDEDEESDRQRIRMEPIYDADSSVYFNLDAKRQDKSDAKRCYVIHAVARPAYKEEWKDEPATWPKEVSDVQFDWSTPDVVYIAEYYKVEEVRETVHFFQTIDGKEERYTDDQLEDLSEEDEVEGSVELGIALLAEQGSVEVRSKRVKRRRVHKYIMSGGKVLEDCGYIAGRHIPIIPFYGKRWYVDNVERCMGQVRLSKDLIRLNNMQMSKLAEISAISSVEKPIFTPEQMAGHAVMWSEDNIQNYPYMLINQITGADGLPQPAGPLGYTKPPQIPPAMAALLQLTAADTAEILGNQQQGDKMVSNISGKAVEMIQQRLDMQSFIFMSNFAKAMRRCGVVWLSMAKELYIEVGRKMKKIGAMNEIESVEIMRPTISKAGEKVFDNDLTKADFDVAVTVGPSFSSRRDATVRALTGMMQVVQDPADAQVISAMALMNMDGEGLDEVKGYFRKKLVAMGALDPTDEEKAAMEPAKGQQAPDPQSLYLQAAAKKEEAAAMKAQADTELSVARTAEVRAKTIETLSGADLDRRKMAIDTAQAIGNALGGQQ